MSAAKEAQQQQQTAEDARADVEEQPKSAQDRSFAEPGTVLTAIVSALCASVRCAGLNLAASLCSLLPLAAPVGEHRSRRGGSQCGSVHRAPPVAASRPLSERASTLICDRLMPIESCQNEEAHGLDAEQMTHSSDTPASVTERDSEPRETRSSL